MIDTAGTLIVTLHLVDARDVSPLHMISAARLARLERAEQDLAALKVAVEHLVAAGVSFGVALKNQ